MILKTLLHKNPGKFLFIELQPIWLTTEETNKTKIVAHISPSHSTCIYASCLENFRGDGYEQNKTCMKGKSKIVGGRRQLEKKGII